MAKTIFSPLLAYNDTPPWDYFHERMPWLCSYKFDGIRAIKLAEYQKLISRTIKPFRSSYCHQHYALEVFNGLDGELILPEKQRPNIYYDTYSAVMTEGSMVPVNWHIFDMVDLTKPYYQRQAQFQQIMRDNPVPGMVLVEQVLVNTVEELQAMELRALDEHYEGLIARDPQGMYRYNRSSLKQRNMIKVVRKIRFEAEVLDMKQWEKNNNTAIVDARGYTVRSQHKENMELLPLAGTMLMRRLDDDCQFWCGSGLDTAQRERIFQSWPLYKGAIVTVECKPYGEKDAPRQPVWIGLSDKHPQPEGTP